MTGTAGAPAPSDAVGAPSTREAPGALRHRAAATGAEAATRVGDRLARLPVRWVLVGCVGVAAVSMLWPATIGYDPWAWLVWGREVVGGDLDTTTAPSWKPFPVLVTAPLALLGDLAPVAWVLVARTAGVAVVAFAYRLAARYAGAVAGLLAAALVVLTPDGGPRFLRLVGEAHGAPIAAALVLAAVDRHLDGRRRTAMVLATGVALLRPEAWIFVAAYGVWLAWRESAARPLVAVCLAAVPVLWLGGDWWGSGHPFTGADQARVVFDERPDHVADAIGRAARSVVAPAWAAAALCVALARRRGERVLVAMGAAAVAWSVLVVGTNAALRYAALGRFFLPSAVVLCVLAAIGVVWGIRLVPRGLPRAAALVALALLSAPLVLPRAAAVDSLVERMALRRDLEVDLHRVIDAVGADTITSCGRVSYDGNGGKRPALAWRLHIGLDEIDRRTSGRPGFVLLRVGSEAEARAVADGFLETVAVNDSWRLAAAGCPEVLAEATPNS